MTRDLNQNVAAYDVPLDQSEGVDAVATTQSFISEIHANLNDANQKLINAEDRITALEGQMTSLVAQLNNEVVASEVTIAEFTIDPDNPDWTTNPGTRFASFFTAKAYSSITWYFFAPFIETTGSTGTDFWTITVHNQTLVTTPFTHTTDNGELLNDVANVSFTLNDVPINQFFTWGAVPTLSPTPLRGITAVIVATPDVTYTV